MLINRSHSASNFAQFLHINLSRKLLKLAKNKNMELPKQDIDKIEKHINQISKYSLYFFYFPPQQKVKNHKNTRTKKRH